MTPIAIIIFILACLILYVLLKRYKKEHSVIVPIPKKMEKIMKKIADTPKGITDMAGKIAANKDSSATKKDKLIEAFEDIKDIRYGKIGASNSNGGDTLNYWIKISSVTLSGNWDARGFTLEVYPRIRYHTSGRQTLVCLMRNNTTDVELPYVSLTTHNESEPNTRLIKDVKIVRTGGSGVNNNKLEVWIQFGQSWADTAYVMYYLYQFNTKDFIATVPQSQQKSIPGGQNWGINDRYEPNGVSKKDITMDIDPADKGIHGIAMNKTDEAGRSHMWKQWHMDNGYGRNDLQLWEYAGDKNGGTCGGNTADGALCNPRFTVKGHTGRVGINTTNPQGTLEVAGDIRIGRWSLRDENGVLVFRDMVASAAGRDRRHALYPEMFIDNTEDRNNIQTGEAYMNLNCAGGPQTSTRQITFATPYARPPRITASLGLIDWCNNGRNLRINSWAANATATGFTLYLQTWGDTSVWGANIKWIAVYGSQGSEVDTWEKLDVPNIKTFTWAQFKGQCEAKGKRLCNSNEMCPSGQPLSNFDTFGGADNWMAVGDRDNEWITYNRAEGRLCKTHTQVAGSTPGWGSSNGGGGWYRGVKCCPK